MAATLTQLAQAALTAATATYFTASNLTMLKTIVLCNTSATSKTVNINLVPSAGSTAVSNAIVSGLSIAPNETKVLTISAVMPTGSFITASASVANTVCMTASGVVVA